MLNLIARYTHWLHTMWPAGTVEKLPEFREDGTTAVPGVRIVGDLTGIPLLKFASDGGARAVRRILEEPEFAERSGGAADVVDIAIVGAGVSGIAAAMAAKKAGVSFRVFEATEVFATVESFPKGKPIFTYPTGMTPEGDLQFRSEVHPKETLLEDLKRQAREAGIPVTAATIERIERRDGVLLLHYARDGGGAAPPPVRARRAIVAIGKSGGHRRLGVPGEEGLDKVFHRLFDPAEFAGQRALVVGGGDSAVEAAVALAAAGAHVTLSYRKAALTRPKPENLARLEALRRDPAADVTIEMPVSEMLTASTGVFRRGKGARAPGSLSLA